MSDVTLQERLDSALEDLNECRTVEDVATIVTCSGITGRPRDPNSCLIAKLIGQRVGDVVWVTDIDVTVTEVDEYGVPLPKVVTEFIHAFDNHEFVTLEEPDSNCGESSCERCNPPTAVTP